jgi:hypothetical protein
MLPLSLKNFSRDPQGFFYQWIKSFLFVSAYGLSSAPADPWQISQPANMAQIKVGTNIK